MSLRSVVKSKVRRSNSRESKKHRKKHRQSDGEDREEDRSREEENAKDSPPPTRHPEKMRRKHSEDRNRSDGSVGRSARDSDQRDRNRRDDSDERYSSGERRKDVKKDDVGEDRDRRRLQKDVDCEEESEKSSDEGERSKGRDDDDRSRGDYDRDDERSRRDDRQYQKDDKRSRKENERPSYKDDDRPKSVDERSHRDEYRSRQDDQRSRRENERSNRDDARSNQDDVRSKRDDVRSNRDDVQSHKDDKRSSRDDDRSRQDDSQSNRNGSDSRSRRDEDKRSRQRNDDRTRSDERRHDRDDERSEKRDDERRHDRDDERSEKRDDVHSKRDRTMDEKSKTNNTKEEDDGDSFLASKRAKASAADGAELVTRTGGAYIPPARLRMMQAQITDKSSAQYQRIAWEALKKSINGLINKINVSNLMMIVRELLQENIVRGRGVLARSIMQAQAASPTFTHVYAALVAIINTKFPNIGELIVKRLIVSFKKGFKRNEKATCLSTLRFIAHLFNQLVCHEVLALQVLMLLVSQPTDDSVEVAVGFLKECGNKLKELAPKSLNAVFESLRTVLHEATIDKRVQYMIEVMFAIRKDGFKDHPSVIEELDIVEEDDQFTHDLKLDDPDLDPEDGLNVFKFDPQYLDNEEKYKAIKKEHLDEGDSDDENAEDGESGEGSDEDDDDDDDEDGDNEEGKEKTVIIDSTETNLVAFRRTLYLTIQSSLDFEECAHKIRKMDIKPGQEDELCNMILDCCAQQRTYEKFFGLLAQRFCMMEKKFMEPYQRIFQEQYDTVHRLETNKLRNVAKFYAHLLYTDAIEWKVLECIRLNEDDTTSSGRIFIKILFQELSEYMGLSNLNDRLKDVTLQPHFEGLFPRDNPRNTRFAINFFTSIGLGGLTDELRDHLKSVPKQPVRSPTRVASASSSSEDDSESSDSSDSPSSSDSEPSPPVKKHRKGKASKTPEKSHKSEERRKSERRSQKSEKSLNLALTQKSDGPTSMQLRLMKLASYSQLPENKDEEKLRGQVEKKRDEDTPRSHGRGQEVQHVKRNEDVQVRRRGQESESEDDDEKERRKGNRKPDKDKREDKGHKRKRDEDSGSDRGQKQRTSKKRKEDSSSGSEGDHKGRPDRGEGRGRERSGERTKDRKRRHRSRS